MKQQLFPFPTAMSVNAYTEPRDYDEERSGLLEMAREHGVGIVHIYDSYAHFGGISVAFKKCSEYDSGVMVEVAVQTCSEQDSFSKKTGTRLVLERFFNGNTIELPLLRNSYNQELNHVVKYLFSSMYYRPVV